MIPASSSDRITVRVDGGMSGMTTTGDDVYASDSKKLSLSLSLIVIVAAVILQRLFFTRFAVAALILSSSVLLPLASSQTGISL